MKFCIKYMKNGFEFYTNFYLEADNWNEAEKDLKNGYWVAGELVEEIPVSEEFVKRFIVKQN